MFKIKRITVVASTIVAAINVSAQSLVKGDGQLASRPSYYQDSDKCQNYNKITTKSLANYDYLYNKDCSTTYVIPTVGQIALRPKVVNISSCGEMRQDHKNYEDARNRFAVQDKEIIQLGKDLRSATSESKKESLRKDLELLIKTSSVLKEALASLEEKAKYWSSVSGVVASVDMNQRVSQADLAKVERASKKKIDLGRNENGDQIFTEKQTFAKTINKFNSRWYLTYKDPTLLSSRHEAVVFKSLVGKGSLTKINDSTYTQVVEHNGDRLTGELELSLRYACDFFEGKEYLSDEEVTQIIGKSFWVVNRSFDVEMLGSSGYSVAIDSKKFMQAFINLSEQNPGISISDLFASLFSILNGNGFLVDWNNNQSGLDVERITLVEKQIFKNISLEIINKINENLIKQSSQVAGSTTPINLPVCWDNIDLSKNNYEDFAKLADIASFCILDMDGKKIIPAGQNFESYYTSLGLQDTYLDATEENFSSFYKIGTGFEYK